MDLPRILLIVFFATEALFVLLYIPRISLWIKGFKKQKRLINEKKNKIGLVIPARDESSIIEGLIETIKSQDYPKELIEVFFIVRDENDPTIKIVSERLPNAKIKIVPKQKRKADALKAFFADYLKAETDYCDDFIIVDADNWLTDNFVSRMNDALLSGADVIIPKKLIKNNVSDKKFQTIISTCSAMTYVSVDEMGNKAKTERGDTLSLCGQGMLFSFRFIRNAGGFPFETLSEDYEISVECIRKGYKQYYAEYAEIYAEEPTTLSEFNKRRLRWCQGFISVNGKYSKVLKEETFRRGKIKKENFFFLYGLLPVGGMIVDFLAFFIAFLSMAIVKNVNFGFESAKILYLYAFFTFLTMYLQVFFQGVFALFVGRKTLKTSFFEGILISLIYPFVMGLYLPLFIHAFFTSESGVWTPVKRLNIWKAK